jgi:hypothetical protein
MKCILIKETIVSSFKDSTDQKACLLEIISDQIERNYWSKEIDNYLQVGHLNDPAIKGQRELVSALSARIQNQRKELGVDVAGW